MAAAPSFRQAFPTPAAPFCDLRTGQITNVWLQFLLSQFARTGGAAGPALDLSGVADAAAAAGLAASDAGALAILSDVHQPPPDLGPLSAGQADLQALAALADAGDAAAELRPVLLAQAELQALATFGDAPDPAPDLSPLQAALADLQALGVLQDTHDAPASTDSATLLALALQD